MSKYIDAEKLIALIDTKLEDLGMNGFVWIGRSVLIQLKNEIIASLQQERPETDLEKEIDAVWNPRFNLGWDEHSCLTMNRAGFESFALRFYKLGKAKKEE